ncbi:site-specific integrase [Niveibacterium sp. SC-1]|uniref:site-specific integrase n=1 Tax=Niveibacterium sp. SC-1 TaxID=3135646 RepID=UPI00311ED531
MATYFGIDAADVLLKWVQGQPEQQALVAVDELLVEGSSAHTQASYCAALRYWAAWYQLRFGEPIALPVSVSTVLQFVVDHARRSAPSGTLVWELPADIDQTLVQGGFKGKRGPMAISTLTHRVAVLSWAHQRSPTLQNPCHDPKVRELLRKTRRAYALRGERARGKPALTCVALEALLATCDKSLRGLRDRALLLVGFCSGGRRRSELAALQVEALRQVGTDAFVFELRAHKADGDGRTRPEDMKPVVGQAARALSAWLAAAGLESGPVFRRVYRSGRTGPGLSAESVRDIVMTRTRLAGLDAAYSAHSLRSGFLTEAGLQGVPLGETMALSSHRSLSVAMGYYRVGEVTHTRAARILENHESER